MTPHQIDQLTKIADDLGKLVDAIAAANYPLKAKCLYSAWDEIVRTLELHGVKVAELVHCPEG